MTDFTDEELAMLTPQEREGLEISPETTDDDVTEIAAVTTDVIESQAAQPDEVQTQSENRNEPEKEANEEEPAQLQAVTSPVFPTFDAPQDAGERLKRVDETLERLGSVFEEGGLTAVEYQRQMLQLMNEKIELKEQIFKASLSQEVHEKTWFEVTVPAFLDAHPQYRENEVLFDSLNSQVRRLQGENPDKPFSPDILAQAHSKVVTVFNFGAAQQQAVEAANVPAKTQTLREMPPSLSNVPAADMTETADGGRWRELDELAQKDIEKYEEKLASMPKDQREAYLQGV